MAPQSRALPLLLTRPAAQGERFAADLAARFGPRLHIIAAPLMMPEFRTADWPDLPFAALILTSETGVEAARRLRDAGRKLPRQALCVGDRTAAVARSAGFDATSAQGDAEALLALILASGQPGPFLHLRGAEARGDIAPRLAAGGIPAHAAVVYAQIAQPLAAAAQAVLDGPDPVILPLFSPRSAHVFAESARISAPLWIAALSSGVARAAAPLHPARLVTADRPDAAAMIAAIATLLADPAA